MVLSAFFENFFTPANITLLILFAAAILFMNGKARSDIVALCSMLALLLFGILEPAEALAGFSNSVVIMMIGLFIVGAGIFRTGLAKMVSSKILGIAGKNENLLFVMVMVVTALVGAFVSNTGTVAVMMPIVMSMCASSGLSSKRYLMPMAFASSMGMFTLISTPPNLVIQEAITNAGYPPLKFFSFAPVGFVILIVGVAVLFFMSRLLTKDDAANPNSKKEKKADKTLVELAEEYKITKQLFRVTVPNESPLVGKTLAESQVARLYKVSIGSIIHPPQGKFRKSETEMATASSVINGGDILLCYGEADDVDKFIDANNLHMEKGQEKFVFSQKDKEEFGLAEIYIMPNSSLINHSVTEIRFRELYNVNVLGIKRHGEYDTREVKDVKLHSGDALLIQGRWSDITGLDNRTEDMVLVGQPEKEASKVTLDSKAPIAAVIMLAMIVVMVLEIIPSVVAVLLAGLLMVVTGCLRNMEEAYGSINWSSIVLIASMMPMATAFDKTGITSQISDFLTHGLGDIGSYGLLAAIYFATSIMTMFMSNTATAVLFAPIAMSVALSMGLSPYPFMFAVAVSASMCFASPFSTPPNALVMSTGGYKFIDYIKVGLPLQLVMGGIMIVVLPIIFPFNV